jgi:hypothetical protein
MDEWDLGDNFKEIPLLVIKSSDPILNFANRPTNLSILEKDRLIIFVSYLI